MYTIFYEGKSFASVQDIETACALALSVHRSSNLPHDVTVVDSDDKCVIVFTLSPESAARLNKKG